MYTRTKAVKIERNFLQLFNPITEMCENSAMQDPCDFTISPVSPPSASLDTTYQGN